jgi:hypothetical protein
MKKSEFSAVEFRLWNNITMAFYLNILQVHMYRADFQHNKQLMSCIYVSFVHLTSN